MYDILTIQLDMYPENHQITMDGTVMYSLPKLNSRCTTLRREVSCHMRSSIAEHLEMRGLTRALRKDTE